MADDPATAGLAVDVVSWQDEEGTYMTCFGSRSWCGSLAPAVELASRNPGLGLTLPEAIAAAGLTEVPRQPIETNRHIGYLEAHIAQWASPEEGGPNLGQDGTTTGRGERGQSGWVAGG